MIPLKDEIQIHIYITNIFLLCFHHFHRYTHENVYGVLMDNAANSNNVATIQDVTSKLNHIAGFALSGPDITVKDSTASLNGEGFYVQGAYTPNPDQDPTKPFVNKLQFEGTVSSSNNFWKGVRIDFWNPPSDLELDFQVIVKGEVKTYLNGQAGLSIDMWSTTFPYFSFTVEDGGSWESCQNSGIDILNTGDDYFGVGGTIDFVDEGGTGGYTCDTSAVEHGAQGLPICLPCPDCN